MISIISNKLLLVVFFLCILNVIRHSYFFVQAIVKSTEEEQLKYKLSQKGLFLLGLSLSYILTTLFTGIQI
jgi:hypothetical protein